MKRLNAWIEAEALVDPIVEKHGLTQLSEGATIFSSGTSILTPVDQHICHILNVADWLLKEDDDA